MARRQLYLHLGLPKCASTALQNYWWLNRDEMRTAGVAYPDTLSDIKSTKHQFIINGLRFGNVKLRETLACETEQDILLSTEGLTNHLYDFPAEGIRDFRNVISEFHVTGVLVKREPRAWLKSYYKQCIINPRQAAHTHYATGLKIDAFRSHEKVSRMLDFDRLMQDARKTYGLDSVHSIDVGRSLLEDLSAIGLPTLKSQFLERQNVSPAEFCIEAIRQINSSVDCNKARNCALGMIGRSVGNQHVVLKMYMDAAYSESEKREARAGINGLQPSSSNDTFRLSQKNIENIQHYEHV